MTYFIDCETRSEVDLSSAGAYIYAEHQSTDIICVAYAKLGEEPKLWRPGDDVSPLNEMLLKAQGYFIPPGLWARNASFDRLIIKNNKRGILTDIYDDVWYDTAVLAASNGYPRALEANAKALGLQQQKDERGKGLITRLCKPPFEGSKEDYELMYEYCLQDVRTDMACFEAMKPLPADVWKHYHLSERINDRGLRLDRELVESATNLRDKELLLMEAFVQDKTGYKSGSVKIKDWILHKQPELEKHMEAPNGKLTLDEQAREKILNDPDTIDAVQEVIEAIDGARNSSTAKFKNMSARMNKDDVVRGAYVFNGAVSTGRFSSTGLQMHNLPREVSSKVEADREEVIVGKGLNKLKGLLRPSIIARPGKVLVGGDLSQIEARALPWLSNSVGGERKLDAFRNGVDIYEFTADEMSKATGMQFSRQEGKVADLLLGFLGGEGAIRRGAKKAGLIMTVEQAERQVNAWRKANDWCVNFGDDSLAAAEDAILHPGDKLVSGRLSFHYDENIKTLYTELPSGRFIAYPKTWFKGRSIESLHGSIKPKAGQQWPRRNLWRGLIIQNPTQAFCSDILKHMLLLTEKSMYLTPIGHTHDEILCEADKQHEDLAIEELSEIMTSPIKFAPGLPLKTKVFSDNRYTKA